MPQISLQLCEDWEGVRDGNGEHKPARPEMTLAVGTTSVELRTRYEEQKEAHVSPSVSTPVTLI